MNGESTGRRHIVDARWWLLTWVFLFLCLEWWNIFGWNLRAASIFLYQTPESFTCPDQPRKAASDFFNFKVWLVVALAQAVVWGVVASVALRWLFHLWLYTRETAGRLRRKITVAILLRVILFGGSLWFFLWFLTPLPDWELGCFKGHIDVKLAGLPAYLAAGLAATTMWVLEKRVYSLKAEQGQFATTRNYLELRHKLQILLLMASVVLAFGVIGLITRRTFLQGISPESFFPNSIVLESFEYTLLLALAYAPVHAAFNSVGTQLRDALIPAPSDDSPETVQEWVKRFNAISDLMQIQVYDWKSFGPGFPILAPFLVGLLSDLLKKLS